MAQPGIRAIQEVGYGLTGQVIKAWPEVAGAVVDPASPTVTLLRPGEIEGTSGLLVSGAVASESASNELSYTLDATNTGNWFLGNGFRAVFRYTVSSVPRVTQVSFDIVRVALTQGPPCNTVDVTNGNTSIEDAMQQESITVDATTTGAADATRYINEAWGEVVALLRARGTLPGRITSPEVLAPLVRAKSRVKLYTAMLIGGTGTLFKELIAAEEKNEEAALASLALYYDDADSGNPELRENPIRTRLSLTRGRMWGAPRVVR